MRLSRSSVTIWNRSWMQTFFCDTQPFNVRLGEEITSDRGAPIFRNRTANRTHEVLATDHT